VRRYGGEAYTAGYRVYTTLDNRLQEGANRALRTALLEYDRRHGYRGALRKLELDLAVPSHEEWDRVLREIGVVGGLRPGLVLEVSEKEAVVYLHGGQQVLVPWEGLKWARTYISDNQRGPVPKMATDIVQTGDIVRLQSLADDTWYLAQEPLVSGALVSLSPRDGAIMALVGGFDYYQSKFNRVIQSQRQPGSNFKPFIYSAALEKGFTLASLINDAPVVFEDPALENTWRPENYSGKFFGPTRLHEALIKSRNLVSIRLLRSIGIKYAVDYISNMGLPPASLPRNLSLALGSGAINPLDLGTSYAVFANGGFRVESYFIHRIEDENGELLFQHEPVEACLRCEEEAAQKLLEEAGKASDVVAEKVVANESTDVIVEALGGEASPTGIDQSDTPELLPELLMAETEKPLKLAERVITRQNHYLVYSMMRNVVKRGTGRRAMSLGRQDLAGKTGTTNDQRDAWFSGFNGDIVATAWVGFDKVRSLGARETGGRAALPMWIEYMREALKGRPEHMIQQPPGLVTVRIDPKTGLLADSATADPIFEIFREGRVPQQGKNVGGEAVDGGEEISAFPEQIF
jgi:penicillin-binding protein 1A